MLAFQSIGGTCAIPLGIPKPSTKYICRLCALVYHSTAPLSVFGLIYRMLVGKIPLDFKKAGRRSMRTCCNGSERNCGSGTCSRRQPLSFFFHLMFLAIQMQVVEFVIPHSDHLETAQIVESSSQMIVE